LLLTLVAVAAARLVATKRAGESGEFELHDCGRSDGVGGLDGRFGSACTSAMGCSSTESKFDLRFNAG
jgi:hypothetical protein